MWLKLLIMFLAIVAFKTVSNFLKYKRCQKLLDKYHLWFKEQYPQFIEHKAEIIDLFKGANIQDSFVPILEPADYGYILKATISVFLHLTNRNANVVAAVNRKLREAIGTYRRRFQQSLNPLYWIGIIVFLPRYLLQYLGLDSEKTIANLCANLSTFIWWFIGSLIIFFGTQLNQFILSLFG